MKKRPRLSEMIMSTLVLDYLKLPNLPMEDLLAQMKSSRMIVLTSEEPALERVDILLPKYYNQKRMKTLFREYRRRKEIAMKSYLKISPISYVDALLRSREPLPVVFDFSDMNEVINNYSHEMIKILNEKAPII